nr:sulfhydryl oxidase 2-like [Lytechinus pictus]
MASSGAKMGSSAAKLLLIFSLFLEVKAKLYDPPGDVVVLNHQNFVNDVFNSEKMWFVEFYSSWCGHCIHFEPTWKSFAGDLRDWKHVVIVAAIDCADKANTEVCRKHDVHGYPSLKSFPPYTKADNMTGAKLFRGVRDIRNMREYIAAEIEEEAKKPHRLKPWPDLQPAEAPWVSDFFIHHPTHQFLVVIFQGNDNFMGKEIILDVSNHERVKARWMRKADNPLIEKWGVDTFPSAYIIDRTGIPTKIVGSDRASFSAAIKKHIKDNADELPPVEQLLDDTNHLHGDEMLDKGHLLGPEGGDGKANRSERDDIDSDFDGRDVDEDGNLEMKEKEEKGKELGLSLLLRPGDKGFVEMNKGGENDGGDAGEEEEGQGGAEAGGEKEAEGVGILQEEVGGAGVGLDDVGVDDGPVGDEERVGEEGEHKMMWDRVMEKNKEKAMKKKTNNRLTDKRPSEWPKVYMLDLESAIQYSLRQEVSLCSQIKGDDLQALTDYVDVLRKYFPGRPEVMSFLTNVHQWLLVKEGTSVPIEEWLTLVDPTKEPGLGLPDQVEWIGCRGSQPHFRGYPCGLWTLFHTLTVSQASLIRRYDNVSYMEVLHAMKGYILAFFSCQNCRENFHHEVADLDDSVTSLDSAILWLWQTHNRVNKRLRGDLSEDPDHPKQSFPPRTICASCYASTNVELWEERRILGFLKDYYSLRNFAFTGLHASNGVILDEIDLGSRVTLNPEGVKVNVLNHLRQREMDFRLAVETKKSGYFGLGINGLDLSMCMVLNISCVMLIVCVYFVLVWRRRRRTRLSRLLPR